MATLSFEEFCMYNYCTCCKCVSYSRSFLPHFRCNLCICSCDNGNYVRQYYENEYYQQTLPRMTRQNASITPQSDSNETDTYNDDSDYQNDNPPVERIAPLTRIQSDVVNNITYTTFYNNIIIKDDKKKIVH